MNDTGRRQSFTFLVRGVSLVEAVVAASIIAVGLMGVAAAYTAYVRSSAVAGKSAQAMYLADEGLEAVRIMRDTSWTASLGAFPMDTPRMFVHANGTWTATSTPQPEIDGTFFRTVTFSAVNRDASSRITTGAGTVDPNTRLVVVNVSWLGRSGTTTLSISSYVSNLFAN